jgi:hypothetical protein
MLNLTTILHPYPYTIGWLNHGWGIRVIQQCRLHYDIKPFKDEVLCDVSPVQVCDVLLGQPYMWKHHVIYESGPRRVIITLGDQLSRVPESDPKVVVSLISMKQCKKVVSQTERFFLFMVRSEGDRKVTATLETFAWGLSAQQRQLEKIVEEYKNIFTSPTGVPMHCQVKHSIDLTLGAPMPNDTVYKYSLMQNE